MEHYKQQNTKSVQQCTYIHITMTTVSLKYCQSSAAAAHYNLL